jgi:transcriptional regulator of acetoin/glycerol metabolism
MSAVMLTEGDRLCVADFPQLTKGEVQQPLGESAAEPYKMSGANPLASLSLHATIDQATKNALIRALRETGGNCSRSAELLGISRYTVYRLIARHGLARRGISLPP